MAVLAKNYDGPSIENKKTEDKIMGIINDNFIAASKEGYKLSNLTTKEDLEECGSCRGSGYERACPCGTSTKGYLFNAVMYGVRDEDMQCIYCEDSGVIAAKKEDEGAYTCPDCHGTGKQVKEYFDNDYIQIKKSFLKKESLQKIYHYLGDTTFYPTDNPSAPIYFESDEFEGVLMPCYKPKEQK